MANRGYTLSSGNVFADLNLPKADDLLAKAELTTRIIAEIQRRRLTQAQAAILGIDQPKISALKQGKLAGFSIERLMRFLLLLGKDVDQHRKQTQVASGRASVGGVMLVKARQPPQVPTAYSPSCCS